MLSVTHLLIDTIVEHPIALHEHKGSALRGAFFHALRGRPNHPDWRGFCANQAAVDCRDCPLIEGCAVAQLLAPHNPDGTRGDQIPRPFTVKPPLEDKVDWLPGEPFRFGLSIVGDAIRLIPYVLMAVHQGMLHEGLGRRDRLNDFRAGSFRVTQVRAIHSLHGKAQSLWQEGEKVVQRPALKVQHDDVLAHAATLSTERLTLHLKTPMRLEVKKKPLRHFHFRTFFQRLMERLGGLGISVGGGNPFPDPAERQRLLALADAITVTDQTYWEELSGYSTRQNKAVYLSGLMGKVTVAGDLTPFLPWLVWGAQLHVGKDAVKGDGWYEVLKEARA